MFENARIIRLSCALAALGLVAAGCGGVSVPRCEKSEAITLRVSPATQLNPDREGFARSVVLRLYQLQGARSWGMRSFESVWSTPFGAPRSPERPDEWIVVPGRRTSFAVPRNPKATFLGIAANFREHRGESGWRTLVRLPPPTNPCERDVKKRPLALEIALADYALSLR